METLQTARYFLLLVLHWVPRILCILFIVFLTLFSFDVFGQHAGFWRTLAAFLKHSIPALAILTILILSWKWSWIGGISYIASGFIYLFWFSNNHKNLIVYLPLFIIGALFLLDWFLRKNIKKAQEAYWEDNQ